MNITEYYSKDHDRLEELFSSFQNLKRSNFSKSKECFREFKTGLQRHIVWEEDVLFPVFEKKTGMTTGGPVQVMKTEHRQIGECLEAIHTKIKDSNIETDKEEQVLISLLSKHNMKEEQILYPSIDNLINDSERKEIFQAMDAIPAERYEHCCSKN